MKVDKSGLILKLVVTILKYFLIPFAIYLALSKHMEIDFGLYYAIFFTYGVYRIVDVLNYPPRYEEA